jgi:demethylmenaquinone methyltransferase/2-methoxy-6-polyprenyl-1,4-benzoquinol methylase
LHQPEIRRGDIVAMFARVAARYDRLNDVLSLGVHRAARRALMDELKPQPGCLVLDVCSGTGALAARARALGAEVVEVDACEPMARLSRGCAAGWAVLGDALALPFRDGAFDAAMVGFAVRDVESPLRLFSEMRRVVRPGGAVACLEFTQPPPALAPAYRPCLRGLLPLLGWLADRQAYRFLADSVARAMDMQDLAAVMEAAGLTVRTMRRCGLGVVAIHIADRPE